MTTGYIQLEGKILKRVKIPRLLDELVEGDLVEVNFPMFSASNIIDSLCVYSGKNDEKFEFISPAGTTKRPIIVGYIVDKNKLTINKVGGLKFECYETIYYNPPHNITDDEIYQKKISMLLEVGLINNDK